MTISAEEKRAFLNMTLDEKVQRTKELIYEWYLQYRGQVYVSFSGGKDSTVLLHIARSIGRGCENIKGVFLDTGLEFPEIRDFVKKQENIVWIKPKLTFKQVLDKYGWPIISKEQSGYIYEARTTKSEKLRNIRLGHKGFHIADKWRPLLDADFKISNKCCTIMKKEPAKRFEKESGLKPMVATMADESILRYTQYMNGNCNAFSAKRPISKPMAFWNEQNVLEYIEREGLDVCSVYGEIVRDKDGKLRCTGRDRTGCMFCMYGAHLDDRFEKMECSHKKLYDYIMNQLGGAHVLEEYRKCAKDKK